MSNISDQNQEKRFFGKMKKKKKNLKRRINKKNYLVTDNQKDN